MNMFSGKPKIWNVNVNVNGFEQIQLTKAYRNGWLAVSAISDFPS